MPYKSDGSNVPKPVRRMFRSKKRRRQWSKVFNSVLNRTGDEGRAFGSAYAVTKRASESVLFRINVVLSAYGD